jgi:hypothetical protein
VATARSLTRAARPPSGRTGDEAYWVERAEALLAPLLHAADMINASVAWVLRWVLRRDLAEPVNILDHHRAEFAHDVLYGIADTDERERSGILSTAANVLAAYRSTAALAQAEHPNFDAAPFVQSADTVYIAAPGDSQDLVAPLVVALLERIRHAAYTRAAGWPPILWALDEVANIAPLPSLPVIVSEGGSQGLVTVAALQDLSQARGRWGPAADGFLTLFGAKLLLPGIADVRTLEAVSSLIGDRNVPTTSYTSGGLGSGSSRTTSYRRERILPVDAIGRGHPGCALALTARGWQWTTLIPWWHPPWSTLR